MEDCPIKKSIFGAPTRRQYLEFVPAAIDAPIKVSNKSSGSVESEYLSIVLKDFSSTTGHHSPAASQAVSPAGGDSAIPALKEKTTCEVCNFPITGQHGASAKSATPHHDLSTVHQVCLQHSYPPSHLKRDNQGLKYMSAYGWNPDDRLGLGVHGEGRKAPIKANPKHDTVGLGAEIPTRKAKSQKPKSLDAGKVRKKEKEDRKEKGKLHELFYQNGDLEKYLGHG